MGTATELSPLVDFMNRIDQKFKTLKAQKKKALIVFITAGDPSLEATVKLVLAFEKAGADIIELGVPFSDPLADGPTIQASSQRALGHHVTLAKILQLVGRIRQKSQIPLSLMMYYNSIFHYGEKRFVDDVKRLGVDGLIVPDLPFEEAGNLVRLTKANDVSLVFFLSPTTTRERMKRVAQISRGFIYYVSLTGVTGARTSLPTDILKQVQAAKRSTKKPVCIGFGISTPQQAKQMAKVADGVIVGSAVINVIQKNKGKSDLVKNAAGYVRQLSKAIQSS